MTPSLTTPAPTKPPPKPQEETIQVPHINATQTEIPAARMYSPNWLFIAGVAGLLLVGAVANSAWGAYRANLKEKAIAEYLYEPSERQRQLTDAEQAVKDAELGILPGATARIGQESTLIAHAVDQTTDVGMLVKEICGLDIDDRAPLADMVSDRQLILDDEQVTNVAQLTNLTEGSFLSVVCP